MSILVTASGGTVGGAVLAGLRAGGVDARPLVREGGTEAPALARALEGVERVFLACGNVPEQVAFETAVVDAAAHAGVGLIVKLSAAGARPGSPVRYWDWHGRIEEHLARSGVPAAVLQPTSFMTNLLAWAPAAVATGRLFAPAGTARIAFVDPRDVAGAAAALLGAERPRTGTWVLTGPEALTHDDVAAALASAAGRPVRYVDADPGEARSGMLAAGLPPDLADFLVALFAAQRAGAHAEVTAAVQDLTGREPRRLDAFAAEHAEALAPRAPVAR